MKTSLHPLILRLALPALVSVFWGCQSQSDAIRETGTYANGKPAFSREYLLTPEARKIPHGTHSTWHPGGARRTLEFFKAGRQEGFAFEWNALGELVRLRQCDTGVCSDRALPSRPSPAATLLATTQFR